MIIAKFGGKSVASAVNIRTICATARREFKNKPIIVVSAVSQVTNMLIKLSNAKEAEFNAIFEKIKKTHFDLIKSYFGQIPVDLENYINERLDNVIKLAKNPKKSKADMDRLVINGEMISSYTIAKALNEAGIKSQQVLATDLIVTNDDFGSAEFLEKETVTKVKKGLLPLIDNGIVPVVTGFMGATLNGEPTTLGRGGSDYSATILGFALEANEIQIWTDVDGVFSADPKLIENAKLLKKISFIEASELSYFGAKVLHPRTMRPARRKDIPMRILNTMNPDEDGTIIDASSSLRRTVKAVTYKKETKLINIYSTDMLFSKGFLAQIFSIFAEHNISVDLVGVSEVSVSVTLDNHDNLKLALKELSRIGQVTNVLDFGIVSLIGEEIVKIPHLLKDVFAILEQEKIEIKMISLSATDVNISLVIPSIYIEKAVKLLHEKLIIKS